MEMILSFLEKNRLERKIFGEGVKGRNKKFDSGSLTFKIFVTHLNGTVWLIRDYIDSESKRECGITDMK